MPDGDWMHNDAINLPRGVERAIVAMFKGLLAYPHEIERETGNKIGEDYYFGPLWIALCQNFLGLLNGPTGNRLNRGKLDSEIRAAVHAAGYSEETLRANEF